MPLKSSLNFKFYVQLLQAARGKEHREREEEGRETGSKGLPVDHDKSMRAKRTRTLRRVLVEKAAHTHCQTHTHSY